MKTLIVYSHPGTKGHCSAVLDEVKKKLENYEVIDLYKLKYNPVLDEKELFTSGGYLVSKQNKGFQDKIKKSDLLIFIYPNWWSSMPAILHGFFDRVFTPGFGYKYEKGIPRKLLTGKKAVVFITSGAPKFFLWLMGNKPKKLIKKHILGFCGIKANVYQIGSCHKLDEKKKKEIEKIVEKGLGSWQ